MSEDADLLGALAHAPLFRDLDERERSEVAARFVGFDAPPGSMLLRQGEQRRALLLIASGRVEVDAHTARGEHVAVTLASGGDALGEFNLLDDEPASASARALDPVRGYVLDGDSFDAFFDTHTAAVSKVLRAMNRVLAQRLRRLTARGKVTGPIPEAVLDGKPEPVAEDPSLWPVLREMSFFAGFEEGDRDLLLPRLVRWNVPAGHVLFREGQGIGGPFLILSGSVEVCLSKDGRAHRLTVLEPGRLFGEVSLVDGKPRSATCFTREASRLLEIPAAVYEDLTQPGRAVGDRLQAQVARAMIRSLRRGNRQQVGR